MEIPEAESPSQSHGAAASPYQGSNQELSSWDAGKGPSGEDANEEGPAGKTNSGETKLHPWAPSLPRVSTAVILMVTKLQVMKDESEVLEWRSRADPNKPEPLSSSEDRIHRHKSLWGRPQWLLQIPLRPHGQLPEKRQQLLGALPSAATALIQPPQFSIFCCSSSKTLFVSLVARKKPHNLFFKCFIRENFTHTESRENSQWNLLHSSFRRRLFSVSVFADVWLCLPSPSCHSAMCDQSPSLSPA